MQKLVADKELGVKAKALPRNDWEGLRKIAADLGFDVSVLDLKMTLPTGFYRGQGQQSDKGWDMSIEKSEELEKQKAQ